VYQWIFLWDNDILYIYTYGYIQRVIPPSAVTRSCNVGDRAREGSLDALRARREVLRARLPVEDMEVPSDALVPG
jgi:hypothetical protein